jgi:hypothetical protein
LALVGWCFNAANLAATIQFKSWPGVPNRWLGGRGHFPQIQTRIDGPPQDFCNLGFAGVLTECT